MLDHKTWEEDPNLFSQASIDADFIVKTGFVMEAFGNHLVEAYQAVCKTQKKFRIILEYDPEEKKSWIEIRFSERCSRPEDKKTCQAAHQDEARPN